MTSMHSIARPSRGRVLWRWVAIPAALMATVSVAHAAADMVLSNHVVVPDPMPAGGTATVSITVENNGTETASNVKVTDTIPAGSTFVSMSASDGGSCTSATPYSCTWASFPFPSSARTITLKVKLPTAGVWVNQADLTSDTADNNTSNNQLIRNITAVAAADLQIAATHDAGAGAVAGTPFNYTLTVSNNGPDALPAGSAPKVTFSVPAGATVTGVPSGSGWTCTPGSGYPLSNPPTPGATITCERNDTLANGAAYPVITVPATGNVNGTVSAAFGVSSSFLDGDLTNNTATADVPFSSGTDMTIGKTVSPGGTVAVGTNATFTLTPRQLGGVAPSNIVVTDTLPAGMSYVSHSAPAPWTCDFGTTTPGTLTCTYAATYNGGPHTDLPAIQLVAQVGNGANANVGTVALPAGQTDPVPSNNSSSTVTVTGSNEADLTVTKAPSIAPVVPGQPYDWNIAVWNNGPVAVAAGQTISVTETIPAGMQLNALPTGTGWACSSSGGGAFPQAGGVVVTCTRSGPLGITNAPSITVPVQHTGTGSLANNVCAALSGTGPSDSNSSNDCQAVSNTGTSTSADLSIAKSSSGTVVVGQPLTYTLTVNNAGPNAATNVTVTDALSNLLSNSTNPGLISASATQGSCTPAGPSDVGSVTVSCNVGTINASGSATVTITIRPDNTGSTILSRPNTATVNSPDVGDPDRTNNSASVNSNVVPVVDVTVAKSVTPNPVRVGEPLVYTVTARNNGPSTATSVKITDVLPANTAMLGTVTVTNGGSCTAPASGATSGTIECTWATIPRGTQYTATFRLRPLPAAVNTTIHNVVNVTTTSTETDSNNNTASADASVIPAVLDILVHKTDSVDPVDLGSETEYTVDITNVGPSIGTNLVMTDTFPKAGSTPSARFSYRGGLTLSGTGASAGSCSEPAVGATSGTLICTFPTVEAGSGNKITVKYRMRAESIVTAGAYAGTQRNHVVVRVDETETQMANNETDEDTTTRRNPIATDLALTKSIDKPNLNPGDQAVYTLTVRNNGPLSSVGAQIVDNLPAGMSFVASSDGCVASGTTVTCAVGSLANGTSKTFAFTVRLANPYSGPRPVVNTATLDAPGDPNPGNNSGSASTNISGGDAPASIPTLSEWGLILLSLMLAGFAVRRIDLGQRRR